MTGATAWLGRIDGDRNLRAARDLPRYAEVYAKLLENAAGHRPNTGALLGDAASDIGA